MAVLDIREISFDEISESMTHDSSFVNKVDPLKAVKHGKGVRVFFAKFHYEEN